jgi:hypothetical protein
MKVSGFSFLRNGTLLGYPFIQSIQSVLPICDEFVVAVGDCQDDTLERLYALNEPKLRIIETRWNENMQDRGYVYAQQKMIAHFNCTGDWAFYLEGDEIVHERDLPIIKANLEKYLNDPNVEALVFDYYHFFGTPDTIAVSHHWYRRAPRIIRNSIRTYSPDGLFFVVMTKNKRGRYPYAAHSGAHIYHYGHVRPVAKMQDKIYQINKYWGWEIEIFNAYQVDPKAIAPFTGEHPAIIQNWLREEAEQKLLLDPDYQPTRKERKYRIAMKLEAWFGLDFSRKHFKLIR